MIGYSLHYGSRSEPLAFVKLDTIYGSKGMFRIHWPNDEVSDMVNLSRARDAARLIARRRYPECDKSTLFKWIMRKSF
jgi:hypothetical protein